MLVVLDTDLAKCYVADADLGLQLFCSTFLKMLISGSLLLLQHDTINAETCQQVRIDLNTGTSCMHEERAQEASGL